MSRINKLSKERFHLDAHHTGHMLGNDLGGFKLIFSDKPIKIRGLRQPAGAYFESAPKKFFISTRVWMDAVEEGFDFDEALRHMIETAFAAGVAAGREHYMEWRYNRTRKHQEGRGHA